MKRISRSFSASSVVRATAVVALAILLCVSRSAAQSTDNVANDPATAAVLPAPVVPQLMEYRGELAGRGGDTVEATFRIYAGAEGGEALWSETERVSVTPDGKYTALLGSATAHGLPASIFGNGQARWLGVSVERAPEPERVPLASVAYAMKAADAATLAGRQVVDFVTQEQLAATAKQLASQAAELAIPALSSITGSGTANTVALFTGASTLGNSVISQSGTSIGIGTSSPATPLDVKGAATVRGTLSLPANGLATSVAWFDSPRLNMSASSYSSTLKAAVQQEFSWVAVGAGNNTAAPTANLFLQFAAGTAMPHSTGLSISPGGVITFASGQKFPGVGGITGITTTSPLTGSGTSGSIALGLNTSSLASTLEGTYNGLYAQLGTSNTFTVGQAIEGASSISASNVSGPGLSVSNSGDSFSTAISASNSGQYGTGISSTASSDGDGIEGFGTQTAGSIGVLGALANSNGFSNSYFLLESDDGLDAGVWADGADGQEAALIATSDDLSAGVFFNDSSGSSTILVLNNFSGGPTGLVGRGTGRALSAGGPSGFLARGIATVLRAEGPGADMCGFNQTGNLACTGQVKALVSTRDGSRQVETYSVQSAENWIEDYGSGELKNGSATVTLDSAFAQTINTGVEFHVFLTPGGDCKGLYVTHKTGNSFEVHEIGGGTANIPFDYKVAAKRFGHENERLIDVTDRMKLESDAAHHRPLPDGPTRQMLELRARRMVRPATATVRKEQ